MAGEFQLTGGEQFLALAKRYNAMGRQGRGLWKELNAGIEQAAQPMVDEVEASASRYLPDAYAAIVRTKLTVRVSRATRGSSIGIKIVGTAKGRSKGRRLKTIDQGTLRHPVFHMDNWVDQRVQSGFWSEPMSQTDQLHKHTEKAVRRAFNRL